MKKLGAIIGEIWDFLLSMVADLAEENVVPSIPKVAAVVLLVLMAMGRPVGLPLGIALALCVAERAVCGWIYTNRVPKQPK